MGKRVLLVGASGAIGKRLTLLLRQSDHDVVGTTRSEAKAEELRRAGVEAVVVDVFDAKGMSAASSKEKKATALNDEPTKTGHGVKLIKVATGAPSHLSSRLALLDPDEFPTLRTTSKLGTSLIKRTDGAYLDKAAMAAAKAVVAELSRGSSKKTAGSWSVAPA
jgi:hypothetical protein